MFKGLNTQLVKQCEEERPSLLSEILSLGLIARRLNIAYSVPYLSEIHFSITIIIIIIILAHGNQIASRCVRDSCCMGGETVR